MSSFRPALTGGAAWDVEIENAAMATAANVAMVCLVIIIGSDMASQPGDPDFPRDVGRPFLRQARTRGFPSPSCGEFGVFVACCMPFIPVVGEKYRIEWISNCDSPRLPCQNRAGFKRRLAINLGLWMVAGRVAFAFDQFPTGLYAANRIAEADRYSIVFAETRAIAKCLEVQMGTGRITRVAREAK